MWYILDDDHNPIEMPKTDMADWGAWMEAAMQNKRRIVQQDQIGEFFISTVFLGIDHSFGFGGPPILFETMIFPKDSNEETYQERYTTWDDALKRHRELVAEFSAANLVDTGQVLLARIRGIGE